MATVRAGSRSIEYFESGGGDPMAILLHGSNSSARVWDAVQSLLAKAGVPSLALSSKGAGGSDAPAEPGMYTPLEYSRDVAAVVDALAIPPFTLVAHSLGTIAARYFVRDRPNNVRALVLLAGPDPAQSGEAERPATDPAAPPTDEWIRMHSGLSAEALNSLLEDRRNNPPQRTAGQQPPWPGLAGRAIEIAIPTLVVLGDSDRVVAPAVALGGYLDLPFERRHLHVFHGAYHSPQAQIPEQFVDVLVQFMDGVGA